MSLIDTTVGGAGAFIGSFLATFSDFCPTSGGTPANRRSILYLHVEMRQTYRVQNPTCSSTSPVRMLLVTNAGLQATVSFSCSGPLRISVRIITTVSYPSFYFQSSRADNVFLSRERR